MIKLQVHEIPGFIRLHLHTYDIETGEEMKIPVYINIDHIIMYEDYAITVKLTSDVEEYNIIESAEKIGQLIIRATDCKGEFYRSGI